MKKELPSSIKDTFKNNPYVLGFSNNKVILDLDFLQNLYDLCGGDFGNRSFIKSYLKTKGFDVSAKGFTLAKNLSRRFIFKGRPTKPLAVAFCSRSTLLEYSDQTSAPTKTDLTVESDSCDEATIKTEPFSPEEAADCKTVENANSEEITSPKELLGGSVEEAETCDDVANEEAEVMPFEEKLFSEMEGQAKEALGERQSSVLAWESIPVSGSGESQESIPVSGSGESRESIPVSGSEESQESIPGSGEHQDSSAEAFKSRRDGKAKKPLNDQGSPVKVLSESELVDTGNFYFHAKGIALRPDLERKLVELYPSLPIEKALETVGIPPASLGKERIAKILRRIRFIRKRSNDAQNADGKDGGDDKVRNISTLSDEELLATNLFVRNRTGIGFAPDFERTLYEKYPEVSIEEGLIEAGLTVEQVGRTRITRLEKRFKSLEGRDPLLFIEGTRCTQYTEEVLARYREHPYVQECVPSQISLKDEFFDIGYLDCGLTIAQFLRVFEIESGLFSTAQQEMILERLRSSEDKPRRELTFAELTSCSPQMCRIVSNRIMALEWLIERELLTIKEELGSMTQKEKRKLFLLLKDLPGDPGGKYTLSLILERLSVPRTTYYAILRNETYGDASQAKEEQDEKDGALIKKVMEYKGFRKGARQIYMMLPDLEGVNFALSKIKRLMEKFDLHSGIRQPNPAKRQMKKYLAEAVAPNVLRRRFRLFKPNEVLLTDVTYLTYGKNRDRAYCSAMIDAVTGKVVALNISSRNDIDLVMESLRLAKEDPRIEGSLIHSDQGCLYLSPEFRKEIEEMGLTRSMSRRGNCFDNSPTESLHSVVKTEVDYASCESFDELETLINEYWHYYNYERRRWNKEKMTPIQYEEYLLSMNEEEWSAYLLKEQDHYDKMRIHSAQKAKEKARNSMGVPVDDK